jgi:hypothetical protein
LRTDVELGARDRFAVSFEAAKAVYSNTSYAHLSMFRRMLEPLIATQAATFDVPGSAAEGARLLGNSVRSSWFPPVTRQALVGRVTPMRVCLRRHRPFIQNSFVPVFSGHFVERDGKTVLTGCFAMGRFTRVFMSVWLGGVLIFLAMAANTLLAADNPPADKVMFVSLPLIMLVFGLAMVHAGRWFSRSDIEYVSHEIDTALHHGGT